MADAATNPMESGQTPSDDVHVTPGEGGDGTDSSGRRIDSARASLSRWRSLIILTGLIVTATLAYSFASWLRYEGFFAGNWDLGINMQLLWTNTHGHLLYEAADYETSRANSFLYVHPTYIAFPISYLYEFVPSAGTLFVLQAATVASSIIPLYLIGRQARVPSWLLYAGLGVYLASLPVLAGILFDFHWEAFIPAEFLWTFYLWSRGRYWWAALSATLGLLTLDVFPVLLVGILVYFAYPLVRSYFASPRKDLRQVWRALKGPALPLVGLLGLAAAGYFLLGFVEHNLLPSVTGLSPSYPPTGPNSFLGLYWWGVSLNTLGARLLYWLLLFAAFGFLPLLYRQRLLILSAPWAIYTVLMNPNPAFTTFGFQYSLIAVAPIAIGFIEGLGLLAGPSNLTLRHRIPSPGWLLLLLPFLVGSLTSSVVIITAAPDGQWIGLAAGIVALATYLALLYATKHAGRLRERLPAFGIAKRRGRELAKVALVGSIIVLVASNVALSPLNPPNFLGPGEGSYSFTYSPSATFPYMSTLVDKIAAGAPVIASDNLFPFVANNPQAFSLLWYPVTPPYLPFNETHLPEYVLLSSSQWYAVPGFLGSVLFNQSVYGLVDLLYSSISYPGSIYLFQLGYSGSSDVVQVTPFPAKTILCGNDFALGPSGVVVPASGTRCGTILESRPASDLSGNGATIWYGPYTTLLAGSYTVTVSLEGMLSGPGPSNAPILVMNANAAGTSYWYNVVIQANMVSATQWTNFTYHFQLAGSHPQAEWRGYIAGPTVNGQFIPGSDQLNFIEIDYTPNPG